MQSTRWQIITILKQHPNGCAVESLSQQLGLAPMTVRQHLTILERDSYVTYRTVRRPLGRPHHVYSVTPAADEVFPKNYPSLVERILAEMRELSSEDIQGLSGAEKVSLLFRKMGERPFQQSAPHLAAGPLEERVAAVTQLLNQEGAISEWRQTESGYQITSYNCPYRDVAAAHGEVCAWHLQVLERMLGAAVVMTQHLMGGDCVDNYVVHFQPPPSQEGVLPLGGPSLTV